MKNVLRMVTLFITFQMNAQISDTALLLIDIQNFYYPGGSSELVNPQEAGKKAQKLLQYFRDKKMLVIHVRHNAKQGAEIHEDVYPLPGEKIISKDEVSCFKNSDLALFLKENKIKTLVICGMQTHMCVEAATRAASDLGFTCILIHDACATKDLKFEDKLIKAADVHYSTLATLKAYAEVIDIKKFLEKKEVNKD